MRQDGGQQGGQTSERPRGAARGPRRGLRGGSQSGPRNRQTAGQADASSAGPAQRPAVVAPDLVRVLGGLLARTAPPAASRTAFADALAGWTGWTDAIALSAALDRADGGLDFRAPSTATLAARHARERAHYDSVRERLARDIDVEVDQTGRSDLDQAQGRGPFRQCHIAQQQALATAVGALRDRIRIVLARGDADQARLAALDAALTPVLGAQERRLLGRLPALLDRHQAGRTAGAAAEAEAGDGSPGVPPAGSGPQAGREREAAAPTPIEAGHAPVPGWEVEAHRRALRALLHAELALRLQPVEGLLAALRPSTLETPS